MIQKEELLNKIFSWRQEKIKWLFFLILCFSLGFFVFHGVFSFQCKSKVIKNWLFYVGIYDRNSKEKVGYCYKQLKFYPLYQCQIETPSKNIVNFPAYITNKQFIWLFEVDKQNVDIYTLCSEVIMNEYCVIYRCD